MPVRLFVGNLPYEASEADVREHFSNVAPPLQVFLPIDRETGRPRGFAFVEYADRAHAEEAISRFNNQPLKGRAISVSEARARESRPPGVGPGGGGGYSRPPGPGGFGPRPGGPPMGGGGPGGPPRPFRPSPGFGGGPPSAGAPRRDFDAVEEPRRRRARPPAGSPKAPTRQEKAKGPIPIRGGGRVYSVDEEESFVGGEEETVFDNFATARPEDEAATRPEDETDDES